MLNSTVNDTGKLLENIFIKKFPLTNWLFGSSASKNDGILIVIAVMNVNCIGIKKYFCEEIIL